MARKSFIYTDKKHAGKGVFSTILGILSMLIMGILIYVSFYFKGKGGILVGSLGFVDFVIAVVGLVLGLMSFQEDDKYYLFSRIGALLNLIMTALWISIYMIGF